MHKTSAWPLALVYAALIVFASLFPFYGWRAQGISPEVFLWARSRRRTGPGSTSPSTWSAMRPWAFCWRWRCCAPAGRASAVPLAALAGLLLSLCMEFLQIYLPKRVPSNLDLVLNAAGTLCGALLAALLERLGAIDHWSRFRDALVRRRRARRAGAAGAVALGAAVPGGRSRSAWARCSSAWSWRWPSC